MIADLSDGELDKLLSGPLVAKMRVAGVRRIRTARWELELEPACDTIPAPPPHDTELEYEPDKPPGTCIALGCMEPGGWHFDRRYCGPHGRSAAGVKP